ncbi:MAG: hypothetical protein M1334_01055 [Patescibacteria group bacterium]|nr:hypothetical protein [Patescibacteria group bacterium]
MAKRIKSEKKFKKEQIAGIKDRAEKLLNELNIEIEKAANKGLLSLSVNYKIRLAGSFYWKEYKDSVSPLVIEGLKKQGYAAMVKEDKLERVDNSAMPWLGTISFKISWQEPE